VSFECRLRRAQGRLCSPGKMPADYVARRQQYDWLYFHFFILKTKAPAMMPMMRVRQGLCFPVLFF
jgi:hypothetical protein